MTTAAQPYDVLIVGSGLMGAAMAALVREHEAAQRRPRPRRILMVEGGPRIGSRPGQHLHDVPEPEIRERYNHLVTSGIQGLYTGARVTPDVGATMVDAEPGMYHLSSLRQDAAQMPAAAVAWNVGGMGVHWTAATPTPWGAEVPDVVSPQEFAADLAQAQRLLRVHQAPFEPTAAGAAAAAIISELVDPVSAPGRGIRPMPMAVQRSADGFGLRTGPDVIFPPVADPGLDPQFTLLVDSPAVRLLHEGGKVLGARVRDVLTGQERDVFADVTVVCADAIRTPQLLFASGIRPPALGRYLNEHAFLTGQVLLDLDAVGIELASLAAPSPGEIMSDSYWVPHSGAAQPFHWQVMSQTYRDDEGSPLAYGVGVALYVPTQIQADNRLEFSDDEVDAAGLPRITVHFGYTDQDRLMIEQARESQRRACQALGPFDPSTQSLLLPAGSSLHFTGTVRMGTADDGTSVCDTDCRVWGFDNLYVAGNGVVPTPLVCNSTLTGMTTAVRAARAMTA